MKEVCCLTVELTPSRAQPKLFDDLIRASLPPQTTFSYLDQNFDYTQKLVRSRALPDYGVKESGFTLIRQVRTRKPISCQCGGKPTLSLHLPSHQLLERFRKTVNLTSSSSTPNALPFHISISPWILFTGKTKIGKVSYPDKLLS